MKRLLIITSGIAALLLTTQSVVVAGQARASSSVTATTSNGIVHITTTITTNGMPFTTTISTNIAGGNVSVIIQSSGGPDGAQVFSSSAAGTSTNFPMPVPTVTAPVTWLGVAVDEVSDDLRAQLPLDDGVGLIVRTVSPDSPAAAAGIQENDILTRLDDQILMNPPQLRQLITNKKAGDVVKLTGLRKGKEMQFSAKLVQKELGPEEMGGQMIDLGQFNLDLNKIFGELKAHGAPIIIGTNFTHSYSFSTNITSGTGSSQIIIRQMPDPCPPKPKP